MRWLFLSLIVITSAGCASTRNMVPRSVMHEGRTLEIYRTSPEQIENRFKELTVNVLIPLEVLRPKLDGNPEAIRVCEHYMRWQKKGLEATLSDIEQWKSQMRMGDELFFYEYRKGDMREYGYLALTDESKVRFSVFDGGHDLSKKAASALPDKKL